jgi:hypothetical protein
LLNLSDPISEGSSSFFLCSLVLQKPFLDDLEVLDIGDESVLVHVYGFEEEFPDIGRDSHLEELEGEVDEVDELGEGEHPNFG